MDRLLNNVERIAELYTNAGRADGAINEQWVKAAVLRDMPKTITRDLAMQLKDIKIVNEIRNVINIYMHDHQAGMPRGQTGPTLCMAAEDQSEPTDGKTNAANSTTEQDKENTDNSLHHLNGTGDVNAATKVNGKDKKGSKGYGECWHCGEWGHPRGECPHLNDPSKGEGSLGALKGGKGKGGKRKGKGGKGKGKGGNGAWGKNHCHNYSYRSPGKGVGKGFNELNDDWYNAWGDENWNDYDYDYNYSENYWNNFAGSLGNVTVMLERGKESGEKRDRETKQANATGEHDPLRNTQRARPTTTYNRYSLLIDTDDSDNDDSDISDADNQHDNTTYNVSHHKKHRPNKRQQMRLKQTTATTTGDSNTTDEHEAACKENKCTNMRCTQGVTHQSPNGSLAGMINNIAQHAPAWRCIGQIQ